jgi:hypothetical protein
VTVLRSPSSASESSACSGANRMSDASDATEGDWMAPGCAVTRAAPQSPQNLSPSSFGAPQEGHASLSGWPHWAQNFRPSRLSFPHLVQRIGFLLDSASCPSFIIQVRERLSRCFDAYGAHIRAPSGLFRLANQGVSHRASGSLTDGAPELPRSRGRRAGDLAPLTATEQPSAALHRADRLGGVSGRGRAARRD